MDAGEGENTEKVEPAMRVKGYMDAMRISVGENTRLGLGEVGDRNGGWGMLPSSSSFSASEADGFCEAIARASNVGCVCFSSPLLSLRLL